jgi:hypothetical protein
MTYFFMIVTIAAGLLHETKTTGFEPVRIMQKLFLKCIWRSIIK